MRISDWSSDVCSSDLWAIRLFALTVGSWLYRMEYALWYLAMGDLGTNHFHGWFDAIMMFFFYVPNLLVAEFFIRARDGGTHGKGEIPAALALIAASLFIAVATWFRSEEHTSELQSLMRISYAVFCLKKKNI